MKRNLIVSSISITLLSLLGLVFSTVILSAQPTPPPHPDGPAATTSTEEYQKIVDDISTHQAIIMGRDLRDYAIAYLVSEDSVDDPIFPADDMVKRTTAQMFHDWETFADAGAKIPWEIVIVHHSSLDFIDREWAAQAYRNDVVFIGLNVFMSDFGELFDSECLKGKLEDDERRKTIAKNWLITLGLTMRDRNAPQRDEWTDDLLQHCDGRNVNFGIQQLPLQPQYLQRATVAENIAFSLPAIIDRYELYKGKENADD